MKRVTAPASHSTQPPATAGRHRRGAPRPRPWASDFAALLERSRRRRGWEVIALDMAGVDTTTATGEFLATIIAAVAQLERRVIGERTKAALRAKRARGERLGADPEIPADVAERIRAMRAEGQSMPAIADTLNAELVPTARGGRWYPSTIRRVLVRAA